MPLKIFAICALLTTQLLCADKEKPNFAAGKIGDVQHIDIGGEQRMAVCYVPAGKFIMGSPEDEEGRQEDEIQHPVTLSHHYWMGQTEVTQAQWQQLMGNNPSRYKGEPHPSRTMHDMKPEQVEPALRGQLPVENVKWHEAQKFIAKLNEAHPPGEGWVWALPTEAQWERACRAGTQTVFCYGDRLSGTEANIDGNWPYGGASRGPSLDRPVPVASFKPNAYGLYDMHGNVQEWCADWYGPYPKGEVTDPTGPEEGSFRVVRGGHFGYIAESSRSANRTECHPNVTGRTDGFRVAIVPGPKK